MIPAMAHSTDSLDGLHQTHHGVREKIFISQARSSPDREDHWFMKLTEKQHKSLLKGVIQLDKRNKYVVNIKKVCEFI